MTKNNRFKCDICGKFMGYEAHYTWTYFGNCTMLEPPDPMEAHIECYEGMSDKDRALTESVSWIKPYITGYYE